MDDHLFKLMLKEEFMLYRAQLRKSIREAKRINYMKTFNIFKNDIKKLGPLYMKDLIITLNVQCKVSFV